MNERKSLILFKGKYTIDHGITEVNRYIKIDCHELLPKDYVKSTEFDNFEVYSKDRIICGNFDTVILGPSASIEGLVISKLEPCRIYWANEITLAPYYFRLMLRLHLKIPILQWIKKSKRKYALKKINRPLKQWITERIALYYEPGERLAPIRDFKIFNDDLQRLH